MNDIYNIHTNADRIAELLRARGVSVSGVSKSINRDGQYSAYIDAGVVRYRVSDHSCNSNFRVAEIDIPASADDRFFDKLDAARADAQAKHDAEKAAEAQAQRAHEAPFIERYKAAREHEQHAILVECFGESIRYQNRKAERKAIIERWNRA